MSVKKIINIVFLQFLFLIFSDGDLLAAKYFVASVSEFNSALAQVQPGDSIVMRAQIWTNAQLVFQKNGTQQDSIYLVAEIPGKVILSGTSTLRIAGKYLVVDGLYFTNGYSNNGGIIEFRNGSNNAQHCRLTNTAIINYNPSNSSTDYKWISLYGDHNRVDHCYLKGKTHSGTTLVVWLSSTPNYHLIDHNYFALRPELGVNGGETIRVGTSDWSMYDSYTTVEYNYFEECNGEIEIISSKSCENIYRYNTFKNCQGALTLRHGNRCTVEGNFFLGNNDSQSGGVRIIGEDHKVFNNYFYQLGGTDFRSALSFVNGIPNSQLNEYFQVKNAIVSFNTFVNCYQPFTIGAGSSSSQNLPPLNCLIANNIVKSTRGPIIKVTAAPINMNYQGNLMYGGTIGVSADSGISQTNPQLYFASDSLWRPGSTSPALSNAVGNYPYVISDFDGQTRPQLKDIGSDQFSIEPKTIFPVGPHNSGPNWVIAGGLNSKVLSLTGLIEGFYNGGSMTSDTVTIELFNSTSPFTFIERAKLVLNSTGSGNASFFSVNDATNYYLVIKHRNTIETWSKTPQVFSGGVLRYNFTSASSQAFGNNMKLKDSKWCFYSGDVNQDGIIDLNDMGIVDSANLTFVSGYSDSDLDGDGFVDLSDLLLVDNNNLNFVTKQTPLNILQKSK